MDVWQSLSYQREAQSSVDTTVIFFVAMVLNLINQWQNVLINATEIKIVYPRDEYQNG
jgi:hypothetical protein